MTKLSRSGHTSTNLVSIAPLSYWETLYPAKTGANWTQAASNLFESSANVGVYKPNRIRGRGAYIDKKHTLLHLGEEIICNGERLSILKKLPFKTNLASFSLLYLIASIFLLLTNLLGITY